MAFTERFSDIKHGDIIFTGNTLGLSKKADVDEAGDIGSIGAFISLNTNLQVDAFPAGTTLNYLENGSSAILSLPEGSTVLHAELVWGGLYKSSVSDITRLTNNSISLTTPSGTFVISPDASTSESFVIPLTVATVGFYVRSQDVTELFSSNVNGTYSVEKVPALIEPIESDTESTNHAGWTLAVVYENASMPLRNLTLWTGGSVVSPITSTTDITLSGFTTPEVLPITGKLLVSGGEGDAVHTGDQMLFGKTLSSLENLSGPNNPENNFFASQINGQDGYLDTTGTFGVRNADAFTGTNTIACRQGWDITTIDLSDKLSVNQTSAAIRFTSENDLYVPNLLATVIDSKGADISSTKSVNKSFASIGEEIEYSFEISNLGVVEAYDVVLQDSLPSGLELVSGSIIIDGEYSPDNFPITIGVILAGETKTVSFKATVSALPEVNPIENIAKIEYSFEPFDGYTVSTSTNTNITTIEIIKKSIEILKYVDVSFAVKGDILTYTTIITNTGTTSVVDMFFTDNIPLGTEFVEGSVIVEGNAMPSLHPEIGFSAGNLLPQQSIVISFKAKVY